MVNIEQLEAKLEAKINASIQDFVGTQMNECSMKAIKVRIFQILHEFNQSLSAEDRLALGPIEFDLVFDPATQMLSLNRKVPS